MKTLLITGATSGIGEALAKLAAANGYRVVACGRNTQKLQALEKDPNISALEFDVGDSQDTANALTGVNADIAVLNAGTCEYVDVATFDPNMFHRVFKVNFFGIVHCISALLAQLKPGNQIVIIDSMARLLPFTRSQAYGASKAAVNYLTQSLHVDLKARGILVQAVSPGFVETPLTDKNDFAMPMKMSVDEAAIALLNAIERKQQSVYFPTVFGIILRTLSRLPSRTKLWLSSTLNT